MPHVYRAQPEMPRPVIRCPVYSLQPARHAGLPARGFNCNAKRAVSRRGAAKTDGGNTKAPRTLR